MRRMPDPSALSLVPIGVGTAYAREGEVQSAYLVRADGAEILLDLGAGALNRLQSVCDPARLDLLVVSHAHPDHCADLFALRVLMAYGPGAGASIRTLLPEGLKERLVAFAGADGWGWMRDEVLARGGGETSVGDVRVVQREVPHVAPTHAVRIEAGGRSLVYGADGIVSDALIDLATGCDLLVCECSFGAEPAPPGPAHLDAMGAGRIAARAGAGALLLTHCYPEHDRDAAVRAAREEFKGPVAFAAQGSEVAA